MATACTRPFPVLNMTKQTFIKAHKKGNLTCQRMSDPHLQTSRQSVIEQDTELLIAHDELVDFLHGSFHQLFMNVSVNVNEATL